MKLLTVLKLILSGGWLNQLKQKYELCNSYSVTASRDSYENKWPQIGSAAILILKLDLTLEKMARKPKTNNRQMLNILGNNRKYACILLTFTLDFGIK
jgi:hypothetical protein